MDSMRFIHHFFHAPASRKFPADTMAAIQQAIADGEKHHDGEICFAVESRLPLRSLLGDHRARARAEELFARLRVWDTARKTGVLIYVLLADHAIEIVPDRGVLRRIPAPAWEVVAKVFGKHFQQDDWCGGALDGVKAVNALLARHLPPVAGGNADELPDKPIVL